MVWSFVLAAFILWGCAEDPVYELGEGGAGSLVVSSTLLGGTEGEPGREYQFTAVLERRPSWFRVEWDFGDGSPRKIVIGELAVRHRFQGVGTYTVVARVYEHGTGVLWATGALVANIRFTPPPPAMVTVPPGSFRMGSDRDFTEQPIRTVVLTRPMMVLPTEVTQELWTAVMGYNPSWFRGEKRPVENITWWEAIDFCNRLSVRHGFRPCYLTRGDTVFWDRTASGYRLPTEAEWEYACRAGTTMDTYAGDLRQPWGGCEEESVLVPIAWYCWNSGDHTHPVGLKQPNAFGLFDMLGNVAEWVWDWYSSTAYQDADTCNPVGPPLGQRRTVRGGAWSMGCFLLRASARVGMSPWHHSPAVGFRIVRMP